MTRCPGCSYIVPPAWDVCRACGHALPVAVGAGTPMNADATPARPSPPPPPPPPPGAFDLLPGASAPPVPRSEFDLLPAALPRTAPSRTPARPPSIPSALKWIAGAVAAIVFIGAAWMLWPRGGGDNGDDAGSMEIVAPGETENPIAQAMQIEAEANLAAAMTTVKLAFMQTGALAAVTPEVLALTEPSLQFVDGAVPSDTSRVASTRATADAIVVAVSGSGGFCAFGRLDNTGTVAKVTALVTGPCSADVAPSEGWTGGVSS